MKCSFLKSLGKVCNDACALNNAGVVMIQQGDFEQATVILKDSLIIMQLIVRYRTMIPHEIHDLSQESLQKAYSHLSRVSVSTSKRDSVSIATVESNDIKSLVGASILCENKRTFSPVLIRDTQLLEVDDSAVERVSGILLYNYGVALCLVDTQFHKWPYGTESLRMEKKLTAQRTLKAAHITFYQLISSDDDPTEYLDLAFLSALVLSCLWKIFLHDGDRVNAYETRQAIETILNAVEEEYPNCVQATTTVTAVAA